MRTSTSLQLFATAALLVAGFPAWANLNIFACEPEWAALAKVLAPGANIFSATRAKQDPHQVQARPSLISKLHKADLAVCSGAELEAGWLPALQLKAANKKVLANKPGLFLAASQVETIDKVENASPLMGDVHPEGNPHLHLDPHRLLEVAGQLAERMKEINPDQKEQYSANFNQFASRWKQNIKKWEEETKSLKGMQVIAYHTSFNYLFHWLGIEMVGDLEPKPGLPPTSKHLAELLDITRHKKVAAIIYAPYQNDRGARWLSDKANIPIVQLPFTVDTDSVTTSTLEGLYNTLVGDILSIKQP